MKRHTERRPEAIPPPAVVLFVCVALLGACTSPEYGGMTFSQLTDPPLDVEVTSERIQLPEGIAFLIKALPTSRNGQDYTASDDMALTSANESVLGVHEADRITKVVLVGVRAGTTCLAVEINGEDEDCIPVEVVENPGLSEESP
jgi:hypothetical protein